MFNLDYGSGGIFSAGFATGARSGPRVGGGFVMIKGDSGGSGGGAEEDEGDQFLDGESGMQPVILRPTPRMEEADFGEAKQRGRRAARIKSEGGAKAPRSKSASAAASGSRKAKGKSGKSRKVVSDGEEMDKNAEEEQEEEEEEEDTREDEQRKCMDLLPSLFFLNK
jgi:hypothetical protein